MFDRTAHSAVSAAIPRVAQLVSTGVPWLWPFADGVASGTAGPSKRCPIAARDVGLRAKREDPGLRPNRGPRWVPRFAPLLVAVAALTAACAAPATTRRVRPIDHDEVEILLAAQATAWNAGDLRAFVATYWRDEALTFLGGRGLTRGHERLLADFEKAYPDAETRGRLTFELIEVRPLGFDHALVLGRYRLERAQPDDGTFTLVVARFPEGIRIVHDHSSSSRGG